MNTLPSELILSITNNLLQFPLVNKYYYNLIYSNTDKIKVIHGYDNSIYSSVCLDDFDQINPKKKYKCIRVINAICNRDIDLTNSGIETLFLPDNCNYDKIVAKVLLPNLKKLKTGDYNDNITFKKIKHIVLIESGGFEQYFFTEPTIIEINLFFMIEIHSISIYNKTHTTIPKSVKLLRINSVYNCTCEYLHYLELFIKDYLQVIDNIEIYTSVGNLYKINNKIEINYLICETTITDNHELTYYEPNNMQDVEDLQIDCRTNKNPVELHLEPHKLPNLTDLTITGNFILSKFDEKDFKKLKYYNISVTNININNTCLDLDDNVTSLTTFNRLLENIPYKIDLSFKMRSARIHKYFEEDILCFLQKSDEDYVDLSKSKVDRIYIGLTGIKIKIKTNGFLDRVEFGSDPHVEFINPTIIQNLYIKNEFYIEGDYTVINAHYRNNIVDNSNFLIKYI